MQTFGGLETATSESTQNRAASPQLSAPVLGMSPSQNRLVRHGGQRDNFHVRHPRQLERCRGMPLYTHRRKLRFPRPSCHPARMLDFVWFGAELARSEPERAGLYAQTLMSERRKWA